MWTNSFKTSFEVSTWAVVAPFNYPLDIPIGTGERSTCSLRHRILGWHMRWRFFSSWIFLSQSFKQIQWCFTSERCDCCGPLASPTDPQLQSRVFVTSHLSPWRCTRVFTLCCQCAMCWFFLTLMTSQLACSCGPVYSAECWLLEKSQLSPFGKGKAATALAQVTARPKKSYSQL